MENTDKLLQLIKREFELLNNIFATLPKTAQQNEIQLSLFLMYQEILSLSKNCISIFEYDYPKTDSVPIILRTIFEHYVNMVLIRDNDQNRIDILLTMEKERLKLIESSIEFYKKRKLNDALERANSNYEVCIARIKRYEENNGTRLTFKTKIEKFNVLAMANYDLYLIYQRLSKHAHPNFSFLIEKDITLNESGCSFTENEYLIHLSFLSQTILHGMNELIKTLNMDEMNLLKDVIKITNDIQALTKI